MLKALLVLTGILNLLFGFFHIFLGYQIYGWVSVTDEVRGMVQAFNAGGALMIFFLAYACLMRGREMMTTGLGGAVFALGALLYLSRAIEEFFWFDGNLLIFATSLATGLLHTVLMLNVRVPTGRLDIT